MKLSFNGLLLLAALAASNTWAQSLSVTQIELKDLRGSSSAVSYDNSKPTVLMFFQPDCRWCKKQGKVMAKLLEQCGNKIHFNLVGDKGSRTKLKRELRHFADALPAQQNSKLFARKSGGVIGYPTTLVLDTNGEVLAKKRGAIEEAKLIKLASQLSDGECEL
nr:thioredoxin fold domain-containing protein [Shewanella sp. WXL01]